jgi:hypothetical protein
LRRPVSPQTAVHREISRLLALVAAIAGGCVSNPRLPAEREVLELPAAADAWWFTVSPGGRAAAYVERKGSDAYLMAGGRRLGPYP